METKYSLASFLPTSLCLLILFPILAYFVYGKSIDFALAVLILLLCYELTLIVGCIPFVGALAQGLIMWFFVNPFVFSLDAIDKAIAKVETPFGRFLLNEYIVSVEIGS